MKSFIGLIIALVLLCGSVASAEVCAWDAVTDPALIGYNLYVSENYEGPWTKHNTEPILVTTYTLEESEVRRFIYVTAFHQWDESLPSNIITKRLNAPHIRMVVEGVVNMTVNGDVNINQ